MDTVSSKHIKVTVVTNNKLITGIKGMIKVMEGREGTKHNNRRPMHSHQQHTTMVKIPTRRLRRLHQSPNGSLQHRQMDKSITTTNGLE